MAGDGVWGSIANFIIVLIGCTLIGACVALFRWFLGTLCPR